jgi:hypothetical protein
MLLWLSVSVFLTFTSVFWKHTKCSVLSLFIRLPHSPPSHRFPLTPRSPPHSALHAPTHHHSPLTPFLTHLIQSPHSPPPRSPPQRIPRYYPTRYPPPYSSPSLSFSHHLRYPDSTPALLHTHPHTSLPASCLIPSYRAKPFYLFLLLTTLTLPVAPTYFSFSLSLPLSPPPPTPCAVLTIHIQH